MQRSDLSESNHLPNRVIAATDGANLSLSKQHGHRFGGFLDRNFRFGPMHLVDIDDVGSQAAQRIVDLPQDPVAT
jgi:hypothetical protein